MKNIKLRTILILSCSAGFVGSLLAHLLVKDQNSNELLVVNAIAVALVMAVFFLLYFRFSKKRSENKAKQIQQANLKMNENQD